MTGGVFEREKFGLEFLGWGSKTVKMAL